LGNLSRETGGLSLPTLKNLGLGCIHSINGVSCIKNPEASYGKLAESSPGKDSTTGHWEIGGLVLDKPFPTYPDGFPAEVIDAFTKQTGMQVLGNFAASGTEIIKDLGEEHIKTGSPIIYTSADSVFQIAAHDSIIPLDKLYEICQISRDILHGKHAVARVIARPFTGEGKDNFVRTKYRKDFSLKPSGKTLLKNLYKNQIPTIAIGKINDLYAYDGISESILTKTNEEGMKALSDSLDNYTSGFIMANLVDFDMLWGHRNDTSGFKLGLEEFDTWLGGFLKKLDKNDILIITSDHGNDPTSPSTDHSREYVPIIAFGKRVSKGTDIGIRKSFADCQASLAEYFAIEQTSWGESFLNLIYH
jgi:phosphopentomutase